MGKDSGKTHWFLKATKQGHRDAQYRVGSMYQTGKGARKNFSESIRWHTLAAKQGHPKSSRIIGKLNEEIRKKRRAENRLKNLFAKAKSGNEKAQLQLGEMYLKGRGVRRNYKEAYNIFVARVAPRPWTTATPRAGSQR